MSSSSETRGRTTTVIRPFRGTSGRAVASPVARAQFDDELVLPVSLETLQLEAAWNDGYQAGLDEGMARGLATAAAQAAADDRRAAGLRQSIADAAAHLGALTTAKLDDARGLLLEAAFDVAQAIIGSELANRTGRGEAALRAALELVPDRATPVARLNPADVEELGDIGDLLDRGITVQPDRAVACGDCILEMPTTRVEVCLAEAVARAREVLLGSGQEHLTPSNGSLVRP